MGIKVYLCLVNEVNELFFPDQCFFLLVCFFGLNEKTLNICNAEPHLKMSTDTYR